MGDVEMEIDPAEERVSSSVPSLGSFKRQTVSKKRMYHRAGGIHAGRAIGYNKSNEDTGDEKQEGAKCCAYGTEPHHVMPYKFPEHYKNDKAQVQNEILAGLTVAFAQVGEAVVFAFLAEVPPLMGLHAAWIVGGITALLGSRPGLINGATGVRAAVLYPYMIDPELGIGYLFYIVLLISVYQLLAAVLGLAKLVRMVPYTVMIGFCNGLALLYAQGQAFQFKIHNSGDASNVTNITCQSDGEGSSNSPWVSSEQLWIMVGLIAATIATALSVPRIPKVGKYIPPSLSGIMVATFIEHVIVRNVSDYWTPTIGDVSNVGGGVPSLFWTDGLYSSCLPDINFDLLKKIAVPAFIAAAAGAVECVMTMEVVNDMTESENPVPNQQLYALSLANFAGGMMGTMGGGATIGVSVINCTNGANGRYRISGVVAAITVLIFILAASDFIEIMPTASLVGIMVIVIYQTFEWSSIPLVLTSFMPEKLRKRIFGDKYSNRKVHRMEAIVIVVVTAFTVVFDLFIAVLAGTLLTTAAMAWQTGENIKLLEVETVRLWSEADEGDDADKIMDAGAEDKNARTVKVYHVNGPLFFSSAQRFLKFFTPKEDPDRVEVRFHCEGIAVQDFSGLNALNVVGERYSRLGKKFVVRHLDWTSEKIIGKADLLRQHFVIESADQLRGLLSPPHTRDRSGSLGSYASHDSIGVPVSANWAPHHLHAETSNAQHV